MAENTGRTLVCSVLFLDLVGYARKGVAEQLQSKQALNRVLGDALEPVAPGDRVILDTGDGAAITFGDPEDALLVALAVLDNLEGIAVRMGINLGPVLPATDLNGQMNIIGDGINVAQRVMSFSEPGQLLVSRSYHEVVSTLSDDYAALFRHAGSHSDKHERTHEVYAVADGVRAGRRLAGTGSRLRTRQRNASDPKETPGTENQLAARGPEEDSPSEPAQVIEAGRNLIISGFSKASVQEALDRLTRDGCRLISPITQVGKKWLATCENPKVPVSACKVESMGHTRFVTGPTREAVSEKVGDLVRFGAVLVGDIELADGVWTAVCDTGPGN